MWRRNAIATLLVLLASLHSHYGQRTGFNKGWKFILDASVNPAAPATDKWRSLNLPHDWSIELPFDANSPTGTGGGALRGGLGWYSKTFQLPVSAKGKFVSIQFDGVYRNSEVWINGNLLGARPNGYISFEYDMTPYLNFGDKINQLLVKVDNSEQPNSRWYSGSGIYRNTWLRITDPVHISYNGIWVATPVVNSKQAVVEAEISMENTSNMDEEVNVIVTVVDPRTKEKFSKHSITKISKSKTGKALFKIEVPHPALWSVDQPQLYKMEVTLLRKGRTIEKQATPIGFRFFSFDVNKGFLLNGQSLKIRGVCNHHDLGALGTAINISALRRQLQLLKDMGCNGIRTSHNPPAPELLNLCDEMGFIVMDEAFDMWKLSKSKYDYSLDWDKWHRRDLEDMVKRDRNHPSIFIWSVGNEIGEQWVKETDTAAMAILPSLVKIVKELDPSRPTVTANNEINKWNRLLQSNAADITGYNYNHGKWDSVLHTWPGKPFIVTESTSALQTRGHYDMPSDSIRRWPTRWDLPLLDGNADTTCSAYDNCSTPWGSTHEESLMELEKHPHVSGMYIWTGFDYIGEPTPYPWPARSSYFGIIDLAGFPKDVYYLYQSVWTNKPVLHLLPHWNWKAGQAIDVWAYYSQADEVELFVNGQSAGVKKKQGNDMHVVWRVTYEPGSVKAVSRKNGKVILEKEIRSAGEASAIKLEMNYNGTVKDKDGYYFIKANILDNKGVVVPAAGNRIHFSVTGGTLLATDNGLQTDLDAFQSPSRRALAGAALLIVKPTPGEKTIVTAISDGLRKDIMTIGAIAN